MQSLDPMIESFVQKITGPPLYTLTPVAARKVLDDLQATPVTKLPVKLEDLSLQTEVGAVPVRIVRPPTKSILLPGIIYLHGGGWILGNEHTHDRLIRDIACGTEAVVIFVKYTLSPEARFPIALDQAYSVATYIARHGVSLGVDPTRLAIAGDSVGGNMATACCLLSKQYQAFEFKYQALLYPVTSANMNTGSYKTYANGPWLTAKAMAWFWDAYEPNLGQRQEILLSPLNATLEQLSGLPPTLVITDENDVLRDEGEAYAHKLMQAKVPVKAIRMLGTIHDFAMLNALANSNGTTLALAIVNEELYRALH